MKNGFPFQLVAIRLRFKFQTRKLLSKLVIFGHEKSDQIGLVGGVEMEEKTHKESKVECGCVEDYSKKSTRLFVSQIDVG